MSSNTITPGFAWEQEFQFPAGFLLPDDGIRAQFRRYTTDRSALAEVSTGQGAYVTGQRVLIELSPSQTANMKPGTVVTNFVVERPDREIPVGVLVTIPVIQLATRRKP